MFTKWYIGALILILTSLGLSQKHTKLANQQIVLQFTDVKMASVTDHNTALATVTKKLAAFGISNIEIIQNNDSQLSIQYYSDIDAQSVKEFLAQESELSLLYKDVDQSPVDFPEDKLPESCSIIVTDLHHQTDNGLALNGKFAFEIKQDYQRFSKPLPFGINSPIENGQDSFVEVALKVNKNSTFELDTTSRTKPEVRAGPFKSC